MSRFAPRVTVAVALLTLGGCGGSASPAPTPAPAPAPQAPADAPKASAEGHAGHSHGEEHALGAVTVNATTLTITQDGEIVAGKEASFDIAIAGTPTPVALRLWIGRQDAVGSVKSKAEREGDGFHAHVEAPSSLDAEAKLWIELEFEGSNKSAVSVALHR